MSRSIATRRGFILSAFCVAPFFAAGFSAVNAHADGEEPMLTVTGELSYRQRIALPPHAIAFVEIRAKDVDEEKQPVAQTSITLDGRQVPVAFSFELPRAHLETGTSYLLTGGILVDGQISWRVSDPVTISTATPHFNAGTLMMSQQQTDQPESVETAAKEQLGGEWRILKVGDDTLDRDSNATLNFNIDGTFGGRLCNSFRGSYTLDGMAISFGQAAATLMACPDPLGRQEQMLFSAFESVTSFRIAEDGTLKLLDDKGQTLLSAQR